MQAALDAGAITQAQADLLLKNEQSFGGRGFGMGDDFGPRWAAGMGGQQDGGRGHGGRGMHGGQNGQNGQNQGGSPDWGNQQQPDDSGAQGNSSFLLPDTNL